MRAITIPLALVAVAAIAAPAAAQPATCGDVTDCRSFAECYLEAWNTGSKQALEKAVTEDVTRNSSATLKSRTVKRPDGQKSKSGLKMLEDKIKASKKDWKDFAVTLTTVTEGKGDVCTVVWTLEGSLKSDPDTPITIDGISTVTHDGSYRMVEETITTDE